MVTGGWVWLLEGGCGFKKGRIERSVAIEWPLE